MNIHSRQAGDPHDSFEQQQRALIDASRALVRAARQDLAAAAAERKLRLSEARQQPERRDEIRLSAAAIEASASSPAEREARIEELAAAHRMERLHTPERIERAAQRLLEG